MKNLLLILTLLFSNSLFAYDDSDLDGVDDAQDRCPNTLFSDLVNLHGCTIKSLVSPYSFDIIVGMSYSDSDYQTLQATETLSPALQVDYYYKNFSLQASTSYFNTSGNSSTQTGLNDSYLGASYQIDVSERLYIRFGVGVLVPTYESSLGANKTDYLGSINLSYSLDAFTLFADYSYSMINDDDTVIVYDANNSTKIAYQNTSALSAGLGYYVSDRVYVSASYNVSNSIYVGVENIKTASLYGYYSIDTHWFTTLSYAKGLSDSATKNYATLRLGYSF